MEGLNETRTLGPEQEVMEATPAHYAYTILHDEPVKSVTYRVIILARPIHGPCTPVFVYPH